ncbi:hypothetical protein [Aliivibrio fischeri]|uniref:hypothetical protein n=1 Tax=Aliivibrio fischeri TaxID=668 RepID=UPI0007C5AF6D|nr:hypothetical protein [Aliivibrio fischeri]
MTIVSLYHGTSSTHSPNILKNGLRDNSYLTNNLSIAEYYAECACDEESMSYDEAVILEVNIDKKSLSVDFASFEEPLSIYRNNFARTDRDWHQMIEDGDIPYPKSSNLSVDVQIALQVTGCVKTVKHLSPEQCSIHE